MTSYTITITPDDDSATTTTLRLDTADGGVKLTDLHLHAGNGLSTGVLPAIDYGLLLRAITPTTPTPILTAPPTVHEIGATPASNTETVAVQQPDTPQSQTRAGRATARRAPNKATPAATEPVTKPRTRRGSTTGKKSAPSGASAGRAKKTAKPAPAKKATRAATASGRAYRRMPHDFATVYQQTGSAAAAADHYGVPRHTAHGWIRRLREQSAATTAR